MKESLERWQVFYDMRKDANRRNWEYYNQLVFEKKLQDFDGEDGVIRIEESDIKDAFSELSLWYKLKAVVGMHRKLSKLLLVTSVIAITFLLLF